MPAARVLNVGCTAGFWVVNGGGFAGAALLAGYGWGPLPWPVLIGVGIGAAHSSWWTVAAWAHQGWAHGWWWQDAGHRCGGDDGDDEFEPPPDQPDDDETATHDNTAIRIRSSYTLAA